ncbi:60S ribosomal protein L14 [Contarinia nasturtii]|uniref:60S ribosomal protein L14 n=1 Tax=Contarinia nasturtii TaxID=265458 RepID=UPI0012D4361D|nr:60S ribosomal protein L14 [Contarinia nasturtii]
MPFERYVETGRVAKATSGPLRGKLLTIVDIIDQTRVLVDGPETGVTRQAYRLNNLQLTKFAVKFPYHAPTRVVRKAWKNADIKAKWEASSWAQKAKDVKKRTSLNDFERFKLRYAKKARNKLLTAAYNTLKKRTKADGTARTLKKDRKVRIAAVKAKKGGKK